MILLHFNVGIFTNQQHLLINAVDLKKSSTVGDEPNEFVREIQIFRDEGGLLRMSHALERGISRYSLGKMVDQGVIERISRGVYHLVGEIGIQDPDLVVVAARVPDAVVCLISALSFHGLTTQIPHAVDIALPRRSTTTPRIGHPPIRVHEFSGPAYSEGIEHHAMGGVDVKVYNKEKSVADAFKYRNKIGSDVALEALKHWWALRGRDVEALLAMASVCRVHKLMRLHLEMLA